MSRYIEQFWVAAIEPQGADQDEDQAGGGSRGPARPTIAGAPVHFLPTPTYLAVAEVEMTPSRIPVQTGTAVRYVLWTAVLLGIGLIGAADEIVFHQLLQWHHFYDHAGPFWRVFSDGVFHVVTTAVLFVGALRLWVQRRRLSVILGSRPLWSGLLLGGGGFQLFDGIVDHKILQLHQVREGVANLWVYDLAWNVPAVLVLLIGWYLWRKTRFEPTVTTGEGDAEHERPDQVA